MRSRLAVLLSGEGSNLQAILDYFESQGDARKADVALAISDRAGAFGLQRARDRGIEALVIPFPDSEILVHTLSAINIDLIVLAGYLRRLPSELVERFRGRIINVHPAPLPRFGGSGMYGEKVHAAVIASGATESAVTVHFVDDDYDTGAVIAQWPVPVLAGDSPRSLAARVLAVEHVVYPRAIEMILSRQPLQPIPAT